MEEKLKKVIEDIIRFNNDPFIKGTRLEITEDIETKIIPTWNTCVNEHGVAGQRVKVPETDVAKLSRLQRALNNSIKEYKKHISYVQCVHNKLINHLENNTIKDLLEITL